MSVVRETLRQQDASFISLREVLELLTKEGEGCTLHDAAAYLSQKLKKQNSPMLLRRDPITRLMHQSTPLKSITLLAKVIDPTDDDVPF